MKRALTILFGGALLAAVGFSDNGANERFRMKTGRDLPSVEQARKAAGTDDAVLARDRAVALENAGYGATKPVINDADERFRMKNGRYTPQVEARLEELGLAPGKTLSSAASPAHNDAQERFHMKTGRDMPGSEAETISANIAPRAVDRLAALR